MNYNRSTQNSQHPPSPPAVNWRSQTPGADDGAGDGPAGENVFMPTSMPLPPQMMSTLQARLEQAAMAGDGPHSTLAELARYAAMFQNMEQQMQQLHQHRNQQQQVQTPLSPRPTRLPMTQSMQFRRAARFSQNQQNQRQQQQFRALAAVEIFREREQRQQQRDHSEPQQIPSADLLHGALIHELELHRREIDRFEYVIEQQHQIEMQHLERIVSDLFQCEQQLLQLAPISTPCMLSSQTSPTPLPSQVQNINFSENRLGDIITANTNAHATQDALSFNASGRTNHSNNLTSSSSTQWPGANQLNGGNVRDNSIAQSLARTLETLQAAIENFNGSTAFLHSVVLNENLQNTDGNPSTDVSCETNENSNMPVPNVANTSLSSQESSNDHFNADQSVNHYSNSDSSNTSNERSGNNGSISTATTSSESQQQSVNTNEQSIDHRSFPLPSAHNTNNIHTNNNCTCENLISYDYCTMLGYIANQDYIDGIDCPSHSLTAINNCLNNLTVPMPEEHGNSTTTTTNNSSDNSTFASFRLYAFQEWQHFAKIARENLTTANRVLETLYQRPEYAELYRQYLGGAFSRTRSSNSANVNTTAPTTMDSSTSNSTTSTMAGAPSNLTSTSDVSSEDNGQTSNELNTQAKNIITNPVATNENIIPSSSQYSLPTSSTQSVVSSSMDIESVPTTSEVRIENNNLFEQNNNENNTNLSFNDMELLYPWENLNIMDTSFIDFQYRHYWHMNDIETLNSLTGNDMEAQSFHNNYIQAHFPAVNIGAIEENLLVNDILQNNDIMSRTDSHYVVANNVDNHAFEGNHMEINDIMGSNNHDSTYSHLENNYLESDTNHTCTLTYLENSGLQVNGLMNRNCAETHFLDNHVLNYNNFDIDNFLQDCNFMENNQHPFDEFNDLDNHNINTNNCDNIEDYEDHV